MPFDRALLPAPATYFEAQNLKLSGPRNAKWKTTSCIFHGGSDSMRVNVQSGAWVCMACGEKGGDVLAYEMHPPASSFVDAAKSSVRGLTTVSPSAKTPAPLPPRAALSVMAFEATLTAVAAGNIAQVSP